MGWMDELAEAADRGAAMAIFIERVGVNTESTSGQSVDSSIVD